ncbi:hypothetical protein ZIOFF_027948 [Zingiber officinale]|uniref:Uncharacterized protein n=2 Tax=Zingiber officinale TaxID=94328 RepID=A0A8J5H576_ZINOF|nr:hypothetical protein ZIOFF_027948 [Zingiber officinale]
MASNVEEHSDDRLENTPSTIQKAAAEFIGTYILIFIGCGSVFVNLSLSDIGLLGVAFAWGVVVTAVVYTIEHISGAHLNPAVTIATAVVSKLPWIIVPPYVVAQVLGSTLASFTLKWLFYGDPAEVMLTLPSDGTNNLKAIAWEIALTFILMIVISGAAADGRSVKELSGVAIGAIVFVNAIIAGKVTGPSMNPARSLGPAIAAQKFDRLWLYIVAPVIGAVAGSTLYSFLDLPENSNRNQKRINSSMIC